MGSGYLLTPTTVLTARHVVVDDISGKPHPEVFVRLADESLAPAAKVVWTGSEDACDVVVLEVEAVLRDEVPPPNFSMANQPRSLDVDVMGFPSLVPESGWQQPHAFHGRVQVQLKKDRLECDLSAAPPTAEGWRGLCGAAVLLSQDRSIVGVMRSALSVVDGRLFATPAGLFASDADFRAKARLPTVRQSRAQLRCAALLASRPELLGLIQGELDRHGLDTGRGSDAVTARLLSLPAERAMGVVRDAFEHDSLHHESIRSLVCALLPGFAEFADATAQLEKELASQGLDADAPAATEACVEVLLSGVEDRACVFAFEDGRLQGAHQVPIVRPGRASAGAPLVGIDLEGERTLEELRQYLALRLFLGRDAEFPAVDAALRKQRTPVREGEPPYFLVLKSHTTYKGKVDALMKALAQKLPSLCVVRLTLQADLEVRETEWFYDVVRMFRGKTRPETV